MTQEQFKRLQIQYQNLTNELVDIIKLNKNIDQCKSIIDYIKNNDINEFKLNNIKIDLSLIDWAEIQPVILRSLYKKLDNLEKEFKDYKLKD